MARDFLAIPAAGVGVERLFNVARDLCTFRRHCLRPDTIKMLMLQMFVDTFELKEEFREFKRDLKQEENDALDILETTYPEDEIEMVNDVPEDGSDHYIYISEGSDTESRQETRIRKRQTLAATKTVPSGSSKRLPRRPKRNLGLQQSSVSDAENESQQEEQQNEDQNMEGDDEDNVQSEETRKKGKKKSKNAKDVQPDSPEADYDFVDPGPEHLVTDDEELALPPPPEGARFERARGLHSIARGFEGTAAMKKNLIEDFIRERRGAGKQSTRIA